MHGIDEQSRSYQAWYPWSRLPGLFLLAALLVLQLFVFVRPSSLGQLVPYWLMAAILTALVSWWIRLFLQGFTQPHTISVTGRGIARRPIPGRIVEINWDEIRSVEETHTPFPAKRLKVTRIRASDGRTLVFDEDLPGYNELKQIVLDRATPQAG